MYLSLLSLGEAMYQPKMYEVTFEFARKGYEGMFMSMTALPYYMTMASAGYLSGYLLDKYSPVDGRASERQTDYIWVTLIICSGSSLILLILFKKCFKRKRASSEFDIDSQGSASGSDEDIKED